MNRRDALVGVSALGVSSFVGTRPARAASKPGASLPRRVLLIDLDDIGRADLSRSMASGGAPFLAQAFELGRSYRTFWSAPICSPFRTRVLTGLDAYRLGNLVGRNVKKIDKTFDGPTGTWLPSGLPGRKVKLGKWHSSGTNSFPARLIQGGYDAFVGTRGNLDEDGDSYDSWIEWSADTSGHTSVVQTQFATTRVAQLTLDELALGSELVHTSFHAVHEPIGNPPDGEPAGVLYRGTTPEELKANMLFHLDHWLGVVTRDAVARGYVVILACDNGANGAGKGTYLEKGIDTPLLVLGDGVVPGLSSRLVQATDLWASVRRLRGDPAALAAADSRDFCDDFLPLPALAPPRAHLSVDWFPFVGVPPAANKWSRAVRNHQWKYVDQKIPPNTLLLDPVKGLWDLFADPHETTNLLDAPLSAAATAALARLLMHLP